MTGMLNIFGIERKIREIVSYATTDQEMEGRALGARKAAELYAPILKELKDKAQMQKKWFAKKATSFNEQAEMLRERAAYYSDEKERLLSEIQKIKKSLNMDLSDAKGRPKSAVAAPTILISYYFLDAIFQCAKRKMDEKREKYFEEEFAKQSQLWEEKIAKVKQEMQEMTLDLGRLAADDQMALEKIKKLVLKAFDEYERVLEEYYVVVQIAGRGSMVEG